MASISSFSGTKPGDFVFFTRHSPSNVAIAVAQSLEPSVSALGATATHSGIVVDVAAGYIRIAHTLGPLSGAAIHTYTPYEFRGENSAFCVSDEQGQRIFF